AVPLGCVDAVDAWCEPPPAATCELRLLDFAVPAADLPAAEADGRDLEPRRSEWPMLHRPSPRRASQRQLKLTIVSSHPGPSGTRTLGSGHQPGRSTNGSVISTTATSRPARGAQMADDERDRRPDGAVAVVRRAPFSGNP